MSTDTNIDQTITPGTRQDHRMSDVSSTRCPRLGAILAACTLAVLSFVTTPALADYVQTPEHFGVSGEAEQLSNALGMAVNESGAGGVAKGSLYAVGRNDRVVRFTPGREGEEPRFEEAWGWGVATGGPAEGFVRCGPAYDGIANPAEDTYEHCKEANPNASFGGEEIGHFERLAAVAVDQATGDVYVRNTSSAGSSRKHHMIEVFTATGSPVGEGFGDEGRETPAPESIAEGPEKLHIMYVYEGAIAVDEAGDVYLNDASSGGEHLEARTMCFKPENGSDYEHYVYCGRERDITEPYGESASRIAMVGDDRLVTASALSVREYPLGVEDAHSLCSLAVSGQLYGMTANAVTGEVFYYTFVDRSIHRLAACDGLTGEFHEIQKIKPVPVTKEIYALAINPSLVWGATRPAGVIYAADAQVHSGPPVQNGIGDVFVPAEVFAPTVLSESIAGATTSSVTLEAKIDPRGFEAAYRFEYLSEAEYQANGESFSGPYIPVRAPAKEGRLGSAGLATATAAISGLSTDTTYRFRAVAASECAGAGQPLCETTGQAASFATYPEAPPALADGRVYELVSPPQKSGGEAFPAEPRAGSCNNECKPPGIAIRAVFPVQSSPGGGSVSYMGYPFFSTEGAAVFNSYISSRAGSGWRTTAMSPPLLVSSSGEEDLTYSPGLSEGAILQRSPSLSPQAPAGYQNIYLQSASNPGDLRPLLSSAPPDRVADAFVLEYAGASGDYSAQFFAANDSLTPGVPDPGQSGRDLYEYRDRQLSLINYAPGSGSVFSGARFASSSPDAHGVSMNGHTVFFEAGGSLYARINGSQTLKVATGEFLRASRDGSKVLLKDGRLFALSDAGDAYEQAADLTQGEDGFLHVLGQSENLSRIYFDDRAALTPGTETGSCQIAPGKSIEEKEEMEGKVPPGYGCNLYLYEEGHATRFIAALGASDGSTDEASPDGRFLAFGSSRQLTDYDNLGPCQLKPAEDGGNVPCAEAFIYDSATGKLACASCNPTGEAPLGASTLPQIDAKRPWQPQPRYLTDSGRLFFDSQDRLSARDANGRVEDVYEAEPNGVGSCRRAAGCVFLISPGTGSSDSNFLAMDEGGVEGGESRQAGSDVFFTTREALVPMDTDELIDVYDAREGGGFASQTETQRVECQGEACQPTPVPPVEVTPASAAFSGFGNIVQPAVAKCPAGTVREGGKCVKKPKAPKKRKTRRKKTHGKAGKRARRAAKRGRAGR